MVCPMRYGIAGWFAQASDPNPLNYGRYLGDAGNIAGDLFRSGGVGLLTSQLDEANVKTRELQLERFYGSGAHQDYGYATSWTRGWFLSMAH